MLHFTLVLNQMNSNILNGPCFSFHFLRKFFCSSTHPWTCVCLEKVRIWNIFWYWKSANRKRRRGGGRPLDSCNISICFCNEMSFWIWQFSNYNLEIALYKMPSYCILHRDFNSLYTPCVMLMIVKSDTSFDWYENFFFIWHNIHFFYISECYVELIACFAYSCR